MAFKRIQIHRDSPIGWATVNPVLAAGEPGIEIDEAGGSSRVKFGDGITPWNVLPYFADSGGGGTGAGIELQRYDTRLLSTLAYVTLPDTPNGAVMVSVNGLIEAGAPIVSGRRVYLPSWVLAGDDITVMYARSL